MQVAVAGIFDEHRVAGAGEGAQDQVERMGGAVGEQDLLGIDREQVVAEGGRHVMAQRGKAHRVAVAAQPVGRDAHRVAHGVEHGVVAVPLGRQPAHAGRQGLGDTRIQVRRERVDGGGHGVHGHRRHGRRQVLARDKVAGTTARHQQPQRDQAVVRLHNCKGTDAITLGKLPDRRHFSADAQLAAAHHGRDRGHDLLDQAALPAALYGQYRPRCRTVCLIHHNACRFHRCVPR